MVKILIKKLNKNTNIPEYKTDGSSGMDLMANIEKPIILHPGEKKLISTGITIAIPNEFDRLIEGMGGTGLNAGTGSDFIYYFNSFPSTQIEKWMEVYSHRFLDPVFRLFQAELEIVYEEKNRAMDNPFRIFYETFRKHFFKLSPVKIKTY